MSDNTVLSAERARQLTVEGRKRVEKEMAAKKEAEDRQRQYEANAVKVALAGEKRKKLEALLKEIEIAASKGKSSTVIRCNKETVRTNIAAKGWPQGKNLDVCTTEMLMESVASILREKPYGYTLCRKDGKDYDRDAHDGIGETTYWMDWTISW